MSTDLLLVCSLANTTCAVANIMANLIFTIVSLLHAFFLVVPIRSSLHAPVEVAVISYFQCESNKVPFFDLFDILGAMLMELQSSFVWPADNRLGFLELSRPHS